MKKLVTFGLAVLLSFTAVITKAQDKSILWEISGNGLSQPSYLLGTIHVMCKKDFEMKPKVLKALEKSESLVMEINYTDPGEMTALQKMLQADKKISEQLTSTEANELDEILKEYHTNLQNVDNYSSQALYALISTKAIPCPQTEVKMYELELLQKALKEKKSIKGLESVNDQLNSINKAYHLKDIIAQLKMGKEYEILMQKTINAFKNEDLKTLDMLLKDKRFMNEKQEEAMLSNRNKNWVEKMPEMMKKERSFFAVGSGHLWGDNGLISLLKSKGYTVKPISNL
ncbi:TraB/GumN family protein [Chryseobacterium defluvii]|uniref:TraB family protein n=1 Tax=Chryseobacterium defluvii TaxID=160396 RepID=A0A495SCB4_9FLAO|nr:TraB/GumN family protein [Chryseobacterium defluvii]RKS96786.1 hypothetical protein BCF58_3221 [Chryseobacterium defluvii]